MRFAKYTFICAGIWGLAVLLPFYALVDVTGRWYAPPVDYPQFSWGFVAVAVAWQVAFLMIGSDQAGHLLRAEDLRRSPWRFRIGRVVEQVAPLQPDRLSRTPIA